MSGPLEDLRVVDLSTGIAGAYATKLLLDAGADVVKVEPPGGDPLRGWSAGAALGAYDLGEEGGALFKFLAASKRSLVGRPEEAAVANLIGTADLVVESFAPSRYDAEALVARHPALVVLSITPFGRTGPWRDRPWTEFTLQAASGSILTRGVRGKEPFQAGGRITEWVGGTFASVAALAAVRRARATGQGEHVDFSLLESMIVAGTNYMAVLWQLMAAGEPVGSAQTAETPSIEPTSDGWVGFCTNTRQQISDFMLLIGRPDLREDEELAQVWGRMLRFEEWNEIVHAYTTTHTTAEIIEAATLLRIPVAPVNDGRRVFEHEQLVARGAFRRSSCGTFLAPRPPIRIDDADPAPPGAAPGLDEHRDDTGWRRERAAVTTACAAEPTAASSPGARLPLAGLRILDMTAWWAGPSATHMLAALGADVIHLESVTRPDGMRMVGGMLSGKFEKWWDASAFFQGANTNKRGLTLDLTEARGLDLAKRLIATVDGVIENFTPRVLDGLGLGWDVLHTINPQTILVRMPAFGLTGPWRDSTGFAQTMEQLTGLAWITGHPNDQPRIQRGPCDPIAGMHAAHAFLVALAERDRRGEGVHVECTMVEAALNAAAEAAIEYSAHGTVLERMGNRSPGAAPQGLYACADGKPGEERWLALSVETDAQWAALAAVIGVVAGERDAQAWSTMRGRVAAHDRIDELIRSWSRERTREDALEALLAVGVPVAPAADPRTIDGAAQVLARGLFEEIDHPVTGKCRVPGVPFRYRSSVERWIRSPAPMLGQHNREILEELLGVDSAELDQLERDGIIGTEPRAR